MKMTSEYDQLIKTLKRRTKRFLIWWCLSRYYHKYGESNALVNRSRKKWISLVEELCEMTCTEGDAQLVKRDFLNNYWKWGNEEIPGQDYDTVPGMVIAAIYVAFSDRGITDVNQITDIAVEFGRNVDEFIRIISSGSVADVVAHADTWFPSTAEKSK